MWSGATHQGPLGVWRNTGGVVTLTRSKGQHPRRRSGWGAGRADDAAFEASYVPSLQQCTSAYSVPMHINARRHTNGPQHKHIRQQVQLWRGQSYCWRFRRAISTAPSMFLFLKKIIFVNRFKKPPKINNHINNQIKNRSVLLCSHTLRAQEHMQTRSVTYASTNEVAERSVGWNSWSGLSSASSSPPAARKFLVTSNIFNCTTSAFNIRFISVAHVSEMYINVASFLYFFFQKKQVK